MLRRKRSLRKSQLTNAGVIFPNPNFISRDNLTFIILDMSVIIDWDGLVMVATAKSPTLVLSKVNAPFLFGEIINHKVPNIPNEFHEPILPEEEYISAIGVLHKKIQDTLF